VDNEGGKGREMMRKEGKRKKGEKMEILDFAPFAKIPVDAHAGHRKLI